jgi:hypothetical protein
MIFEMRLRMQPVLSAMRRLTAASRPTSTSCGGDVDGEVNDIGDQPLFGGADSNGNGDLCEDKQTHGTLVVHDHAFGSKGIGGPTAQADHRPSGHYSRRLWP